MAKAGRNKVTKRSNTNKINRLKKQISFLEKQKKIYDDRGITLQSLTKELAKPGGKINATARIRAKNFLSTYKKDLKELKTQLVSLTGGALPRTEAKDMRPSPKTGRYGKGEYDSGGFEGEEARQIKRKDKKEVVKNSKDKTEDAPKQKRTGPSSSDIMGGKDGPSGPLGSTLDKIKKKKKKSMMGSNRFMAGKGRYGDIKPGVYKGQR